MDYVTSFLFTSFIVRKSADMLRYMFDCFFNLWNVYRIATGETELVLEEKDEHFSISVSNSADKKYLVFHLHSISTDEYRVINAAQPRDEARVVFPREKG